MPNGVAERQVSDDSGRDKGEFLSSCINPGRCCLYNYSVKATISKDLNLMLTLGNYFIFVQRRWRPVVSHFLLLHFVNNYSFY